MTAPCTIRSATDADFPEIARLLEAAAPGSHLDVPNRRAGEQHLLVLDAPDGHGLAAAALVSIDGPRAHISMLVIDIRYRTAGLEDRMLGVIKALSRAFGARSVDVPHGPVA
jgi:N-acetylglutamate synthase-like GNAT family acetyltransferase